LGEEFYLKNFIPQEKNTLLSCN